MAFSRFFKPNIGKLRENRDVPSLAAALSHEDPGIRMAAARALIDLGEEGRDRLLDWMAAGESSPVRQILEELAGGESFEKSSLIPLLIRAGPDVRGIISKELAAAGIPEEMTLVTALRDPLRESRIAAVILLSRRDARAAEFLRPLLFDRDPELAAEAARALKTMQWKSEDPRDLVRYHVLLNEWKELIKYRQHAIPALLQAIRDPDPKIRKEAVRTLGKIRNMNAFPEVTRLISDPDASVRAGALEALGEMGEPRAVPLLLPCLNDPVSQVRIEAAWALDHLGWKPQTDTDRVRYLMAREQWNDVVALGRVAVPALVDSLIGSQSGSRMGILEALTKIGRPAQEALAAYANARDPAIRKTARTALAEMVRRKAEDEKRRPVAKDSAVYERELKASEHAQKGFLASHGPLKPVPSAPSPSAVPASGTGKNDHLSLAEIMAKGQVDLSKIPVQNPPRPKNGKSVLPGAQYIEDINKAISEFHKNSGFTPGVVPDGAGSAGKEMPRPAPVAEEAVAEEPVKKPEELSLPQRRIEKAPEKPPEIAKTREQIIADLIKGLKHPDPLIRIASVESLKIYPEPGRNEIKKLLPDPDARVRESAADALGDIGDETCVPPLIAVTRDAEIEVRIAAIKSLGKLRDERAIPHLISCFTDEYPVIRHVAADSLIQIGEEAIIALILYLDDKKPLTRQMSARALGKSRDERVILPLVKKIGDPDPDMRSAVVQALSLIGLPCIEPLAALLLRGSRDERLGALDALGYIPDERAKTAIAQALSDPDELVRIRAAQVLRKNDALNLWSKVWAEQLHHETQLKKRTETVLPGGTGVPPAAEVKTEVSRLIDSLRTGDRKAQVSASFKLMVLGRPAVEALLTTLKNEDPTLRSTAQEILGEMQETAVDPLINALSDTTSLVRLVAARNLGRIGSGRAIEPLLESFESETDPDVKSTIAESLGYMGDNHAVEPLIRGLRDRSLSVQVMAARALGYIGGDTATSGLILALNDIDEQVREAALSALRDPLGQVQEHLVGALRNPDRHIAQGAAEALGKVNWSSQDPTDTAYFLVAKERWGELDQLGPAALPPLRDLLRSPQTEIRIEVIKAIGRIGSSDAIPLLIRALKDPNFMVRRRAEQAMIDIGDPARDALLVIPDHDDPEYLRIIRKIESRKDRPSP